MLDGLKEVQGKITRANQQIKELHEKGNHKEALALARQTVEFAREHLGEGHYLVAVSLGNLAVAYKWLGYVDEAKQLYDKILTWHDQIGEIHNEFYANTLNNLAELYVDCGDDATAESLHLQALRILESILPPYHPTLADSLSNLALVYARTGRAVDAENLLRRALAIDERTVGTNHFLYGMRLSNFAAVLHSMGQHAEAMRLLRRGARTIYDTMGRNHPFFAEALLKVGNIYRSVGDLPEAERLFREALEIQLTSVGKTQRVADVFEMLASLYAETGKGPEAISALAQAQEIRREIGQSPSARALSTLADLYSSMDDLESAESIFREMARIEEASDENSPLHASTLNNLGQVLKSRGKFPDAERLYRRALAIRSASGRDGPDRATILHNLAMLCAATDRAAEALDLMKESEAISERQIGQIFSAASERQRFDYLEEVADRTSCLLSLVVEHFPHDPSPIRTAFELVLRRKGIGAEAHAIQRTAILGDRNPTLKLKLREISELKERISQHAWSGSVTGDWAAQKQRSAGLRAQLEQLEMELAQEISETSLATLLSAVDTDSVAFALPEGTILVEFAQFHSIDFRHRPTQTQSALGPAHYVVFVLPAGAPDKLQMFDLGERWPIDQRIAKYREFLSTVGEETESPRTQHPSWPTGEPDSYVGDELRQMLLDPFREAIGECRCMLVAPVGDLTRLPLQLLPLEGDRYVTNAFNVGYLSTGRDILRFRTSAAGEPTDPVVIADPDFDLKAEDLSNRKGDTPSTRNPLSFLKDISTRLFNPPGSPATDSSSTKPMQRSQSSKTEMPATITARNLMKRGISFQRLPGTRVEGKRVALLLDVPAWSGAEALKERIRTSRSPRILHIATHGFFLADQTRDAAGERPDPRATHAMQGDLVGGLQGPGMENPLVRSGLALAGANTTLTGRFVPPNAENGLLTAEEISGLDLSATELMTLPDCDTALGDLHASEGVLGLRRSCLVAGARTLVMSLWKVPDLSTAILMVKFYENLREGFGRCDALLAAQDYLRKVTVGELRSAWLNPETIDEFATGSEEAKSGLEREYVHQPDELRPFAHPFFWGAFICEGYPGQMVWKGLMQAERCRVPDFVWRRQQGSASPAHPGVRVEPARSVFRALEPRDVFDLPRSVSPDIGLVVSPDSRRVAYAVQDRRGMHIEVHGRPFRSYEHVFGLKLANNGVVYGASRRRQMFVVFRDQDHDGWDDIGSSSPVISADSRRVAYTACRGNKWYAVIDGLIVGGPYEGFGPGGILFSPDSRRYAYVVKRGSSWCAVVDGAEDRTFPIIVRQSLTFSPNSAQIAYVAYVKGRRAGAGFIGEAATVVNREAGQTWPVDEVTRKDGLSAELYFSPDSTRLAYSGLQNGRSFVVVGDQVYGKYDALISGWGTKPDGKAPIHHSENLSTIAFSPDSRRVAYAARRGGESFLVLLDGAEQRFKHYSILSQPPLFSPDSEHVAYGVEQYLEQGVAIDGRVRWAYSGLPPAQWNFSPDSTRLAYAAWKGTGHPFLAVSGWELPFPGSILVSSSIVWDELDHFHCLATDGKRIWVQNAAADGAR